MACDDCVEFLLLGSTVLSGSPNTAYDRIVTADELDAIPLVLVSAKALDRDDTTLVDQTPAWLGTTVTGAVIVVGGKPVYRLTVTVHIDAARVLLPEVGDPLEWGPGTYTIELVARVEDNSKDAITCLFDVCITGLAEDFRALAWAGFGTNDAVFAFDRVTGDEATNNPIYAAPDELHGCGVDRSVTPSFVYTARYTGSNNSFLERVVIDKSSGAETSLVNVTNGQGAPVDDIAVDKTQQIVWIAKTDHLVRVPIGPPWTQESILSLPNLMGQNLALGPDELGARLFYGREESDMDGSPAIYRINSSSPYSNTLIASQATIDLIPNITTGSELFGLVYVPKALSGLEKNYLFALNNAGDCYRLDEDGTGGVMIVQDGTWDSLGIGQSRQGIWSCIRYHDQENRLWLLGGRFATVKRMFVMDLDGGNQEIRIAKTDAGTSYLGFDFGSEVVS